MIINNYWLLTIFGVICIILSYVFGWCMGYKCCDKETEKWIEHMTEKHKQESEKRIDEMFEEHLAREEKNNENI